MSDGTGGRFARWSQRKHAARGAARGRAAPVAVEDVRSVTAEHKASPAGADIPPAAEQQAFKAPPTTSLPEPAQQAAPTEAPVKECPPLPPLEDLKDPSDYVAYFADGVPEELSRAAMRKLWLSDPAFACLDGLNDYDHDYNVIDHVISAAQSSYKAGRGYVEEESARIENDNDATRVKTSDAPSSPADENNETHAQKEGAEGDAENTSPRPVAASEGDDAGRAAQPQTVNHRDNTKVSEG